MADGYKLLILDWDGTLIDSSQAIIKSIQYAAKEQGLSEPSTEAICSLWGMTIREIAHTLFPNLNYDKFADCYYQNYAHCEDSANLFPDVLPTLENLHANKYILAIATNKIQLELLALLKNLELTKFFSAMRCGDDEFVKPSPKVLLSILDELSVHPSNAVMVGDSQFDILAAQRAGVDAIAVAYGLNSRKNLLQKLLQHNPAGCISKFSDLKKFL